jgi:hypothetical protein
MKAILKTLNPKLGLDYNETFTSEKNTKICRSLVKELRRALAPKFSPSIGQLTKWLSCLHKSCRSQRNLKTAGKIGEDKRRTHANSRVNEVSNYAEFHDFIPIYILTLAYIEKNSTNKGRQRTVSNKRRTNLQIRKAAFIEDVSRSPLPLAGTQRDGRKRWYEVRHRCIRLLVAIGRGLTF